LGSGYACLPILKTAGDDDPVRRDEVGGTLSLIWFWYMKN